MMKLTETMMTENIRWTKPDLVYAMGATLTAPENVNITVEYVVGKETTRQKTVIIQTAIESEEDLKTEGEER